MYNFNSKKVFVSRDLVVDESSHYNSHRDKFVKKQCKSFSVATPNQQKGDTSLVLLLKKQFRS